MDYNNFMMHFRRRLGSFDEKGKFRETMLGKLDSLLALIILIIHYKTIPDRCC